MDTSSRNRDLSTAPTSGLFVALTVGLCVTLAGLYLGPRRYLAAGGGPWVSILPTTFGVWETRSFGEHVFLAFLNPEDVAAGRAYGHYSQPWMILQYVLLQPLRWLGVPYERGQMALCLPQFGLIAALLFVHLRAAGGLGLRPLNVLQILRLAVITTAVAGVMTLPAFWIPFFRFNPEQYFFLPALAFCYLGAADYRGTRRPRDALLTLLPIALFAPVFIPFAVVTWVVLWEADGHRESAKSNVQRMGILGLILATGVMVFLLPSLVGRLSAFTPDGSGVLFRSGLDGSQEHFSSMLQALWAPSYPRGRPWQLFQWPAAAFVAIAATAVSSRAIAARMARQLFISWTPLLWMVIVFPQLVSVHPYYFDFHITLGAAFCLAFWLQRPELGRWVEHPAARLAIGMTCAALLMTNLIDLARAR